jgi:hypothetical protein
MVALLIAMFPSDVLPALMIAIVPIPRILDYAATWALAIAHTANLAE